MNADEAGKLLAGVKPPNTSIRSVSSDDDIERIKAQYDEKMARELKELSTYRTALKEEFANLDPNDASTAAAARKHVVALVPVAATQLEYLIQHAESETVRAGLVKYVFDITVKQAISEAGDDEMSSLIKRLTNTPTPTT